MEENKLEIVFCILLQLNKFLTLIPLIADSCHSVWVHIIGTDIHIQEVMLLLIYFLWPHWLLCCV